MHTRACIQSPELLYVSLGKPRRIWAIGAIHAELDALMDIHDDLLAKILPGDRILYLGNYIGFGPKAVETIDEILTFRRNVLAIPGMMAGDIVYLRGGQEEMWQKLLQLQFAPNPTEVLLWTLGKGMAQTLESYKIDPHEGVWAAQQGVMPLTRWTQDMREKLHRNPGHSIFFSHLRRAAYLPENSGYPMLFVNAGVDPKRPLVEQGDQLWWGGQDFNTITTPLVPFQKVIRGFDPKHQGLHINCVTATIDGGCGFGGHLVCAGFNAQGGIQEMIEA